MKNLKNSLAILLSVLAITVSIFTFLSSKEIDLESKVESIQESLGDLDKATLKREDILYGISRYYSTNDQDKTLTTTYLFKHSNENGKNKVYWYNADGGVKNFIDGDVYSVWANIMVRGKKSFEEQNLYLVNEYIGEFEVGKKHKPLKLGESFSNGERMGDVSIMFFAIKK